MERQAAEQRQTRNMMEFALGMTGGRRIRASLPPPGRLENGDTRVVLLARSRHLLFSTPDRWTESQRQRAGILFAQYPHLKDAYDLVGRLRAIFRLAKNPADAARRLNQWYEEVMDSRFGHLKVVAGTILSRIGHILEYFVDHATNAYAESINSKIKAFRCSLHGVSDPSFFFYRVMRILG
jgi:transposase